MKKKNKYDQKNKMPSEKVKNTQLSEIKALLEKWDMDEIKKVIDWD